MKTTLALAVLFIVVLAGGYVWHTHTESSYASPASYQASTTTTAYPTPTKLASTTTSSSSSTPVKQTTTAANAYTIAQVATHTTSNDCWTTINGGVYNLTAWVSKHPGGEGPILSICGKDGSSAFNGQHGDDGRAQQMLATFKIGTLSQ